MILNARAEKGASSSEGRDIGVSPSTFCNHNMTNHRRGGYVVKGAAWVPGYVIPSYPYRGHVADFKVQLCTLVRIYIYMISIGREGGGGLFASVEVV